MSAKSALSEPIWYPGPETTHGVYARQRFRVSGPVADAWIQCAASAPFRVFLNGRALGTGLGPQVAAAPAWERFELTPLLDDGTNVLLVFIAGQAATQTPWFRAQGEIVHGNTSRTALGSGTLWSLRRADAWQQLQAGPMTSTYAANLESAGWESGQADDSEWRSAQVVPGPEPVNWTPRAATELEVFATEVLRFGEVEVHAPLDPAISAGPMRSGKCVHREALLRPGRQRALVQTRDPQRAVVLMLDLGCVRVGYPRLRLQGPAGGVIELGFAQRPDQLHGGLRYVSAEGRQDWISHQLQTCRYLMVRLWNWPDPVELDCISLMERRVLVPTQNHLDADTDLSTAWDTGQATLNACRQEVYHPQRQPSMPDWLSLRPVALNGYALHADYQTAAAMLDSSPPPTVSIDTAQEAVSYVLFIAEYYQHSGDRRLLQKFYPQIQRIVALCAQLATADALLPATGDGGKGTALNALYAAMLEVTPALARVVGKRGVRKELEQRRTRVRQGLQQAWDPHLGLFTDNPGMQAPRYSQWANALMLLHGLARPRQVAQILAALNHPAATAVDDPVGCFYLSAGLFAVDAHVQALAAVHQQWLRHLSNDGPTWPEKWTHAPELLPPVGAEHLLATHLLGVQPAAPGYQVLGVRPQSCGRTRAAGQLLTPRGPVQVDWTADDARHFCMEVSVPAGETQLCAPRMGIPMPTITLNGETLWRNEKMYPNAHVRDVISTQDRVVFLLQQEGSYDLTVT